MPTAQQLFDRKIGNVRKIVQHRSRKYGLPDQDAEDVQQHAALILWRQCQLGIPNINCAVVATAAWDAFNRRDRGRRIKAVSLDAEDQDGRPIVDIIPARERNSVRVDGVRLTLADAMIDEPAKVEAVADGLSSTELAARLGVTRQYINLLAREFGGVKIGRKWRFPADGTRRRTRQPGSIAAGQSNQPKPNAHETSPATARIAPSASPPNMAN